MRIHFNKGKQRIFLKNVLKILDCPSLRELGNRLNLNYSTLKNYFNESRNLSEFLFNDLCDLAKIDKIDLDFEILNENWGQVKGGIISKK